MPLPAKVITNSRSIREKTFAIRSSALCAKILEGRQTPVRKDGLGAGCLGKQPAGNTGHGQLLQAQQTALPRGSPQAKTEPPKVAPGEKLRIQAENAP